MSHDCSVALVNTLCFAEMAECEIVFFLFEVDLADPIPVQKCGLGRISRGFGRIQKSQEKEERAEDRDYFLQEESRLVDLPSIVMSRVYSHSVSITIHSIIQLVNETVLVTE